MGTYNIYFLPDGETLSNWCRRNKVPYSYVHRRLDKGMLVKDACEEALKAYRNPRSKNFIMYKGKTLCSSFSGKAYTRILEHIRKGKTPEQAVADYERNKQIGPGGWTRNSREVLNLKTGKIYPSGIDCAKELGVVPSTVYRRIKRGTELIYNKQEKNSVDE